MIIDSIKKEAKTYTPLHWILILASVGLIFLMFASTFVQQKSTNSNKEKEIKLKETKEKYVIPYDVDPTIE